MTENLIMVGILYKEFMLKSTPNGMLFIMHFLISIMKGEHT